jgi:predicted pyridoxine 5'-phosphate oxidase superfamily flavin-nucleotide-binding protein
VTHAFHAGELAVQARAGVASDAQRVGRSIASTIDERQRDFRAAQRVVALAGEDEAGALWATPLLGEPGFARALADDAIELAARLAPDDPLAALRPGARVGALAIDLDNRRRLRANGRLRARTEDRLAIELDEVFWNCPKYIQRRVYDVERVPDARAPRDLASWLASTGTVFLASAHAERGLDASHRGGAPGFVRLVEPGVLAFPDYAGNNMFQTLGNLTLDSRVGLAFPDFERGRVLQVTGRASLDDERTVRVRIERTVERALPDAARWRSG